uniref:Uncharacterized protein n=1 Tax=Glossina palpalis gambiensis TaxID=67801 RepID=A0A1B0C6C2_9MUSC
MKILRPDCLKPKNFLFQPFADRIGTQKILLLWLARNSIFCTHTGPLQRNERYSLFLCETWSGYLFLEDLQRLEKGRYKFVSPFRAYDERSGMRPEVICIKVRDDIIKANDKEAPIFNVFGKS